MKITDLRCGRTFEGEYIETIAGNSQPTDAQLLTYLDVREGDTQYEQHRKPTTHKRIVMKHPGGYWVITLNKKFYKVET